MIEGLRRQSVGLDHERNIGRLDRDLHVVEADLVEIGELHPGRLDECLGCGSPVLLVQARVQGARVDADADRDAAVARLGSDELDLLGLAQVARVQPEPVHSGLESREGHLVVEVHVGHYRHRRAGHDHGEAFGRFLLVARAAHDVRPGRRERVHLGQGPLGVGSLGHCHGLHRHGRAAADENLSYLYLAGLATLCQRRTGSGHREPA